MNGKNLNVRYRKNAYAKTRIKVIAAIFGVVAIALVILFLVVGGLLNKKVEDDQVNSAVQGTQSADTSPKKKTVPSVNGYGVNLSGATLSAVNQSLADVSKSGGNNISFLVRDASGSEIYKSALAVSKGRQTGEGYIDIGDIESRATTKGISTSAIVPVYSFAKTNDIERATELFYDASICVEAFREGADDVLIKLEGAEITEKNIEELLRLAGWVKELDENVVLGISLTRSVLTSEKSETLVAKLSESYDFLALDLTSMKGGETVLPEGSNNEIQFYMLMYKMRVLLPDLGAEELGAIISEIESMNVNNWQTVVK